MAATQRVGFTDQYHTSRLLHVTGTSYPAVPTGTYLALYAGTTPLSDGTGGVEATGTRPSITFGSAQTDSASGRQYIANTSALTNIALTNAAQADIVGFGVYSAATGGSPIYIGRLSPFHIAANGTVTIPAGAIRMYAETAV